MTILVATSVGRVAVISLAIAEGAGITLAGIGGEDAGDILGEKAHELYDWAKAGLERWI